MIELKHLTKKYDHFLAVEDLNLKIGTGEFFGLLGPNGAGKTTTIGMLSTLLLPTSGEIWINGELLTRQKNQLKQKLSVVTQEYVFIIFRSKRFGSGQRNCWNSAG